jgi:hypothetical protein
MNGHGTFYKPDVKADKHASPDSRRAFLDGENVEVDANKKAIFIGTEHGL